jgi:hypothetical protein
VADEIDVLCDIHHTSMKMIQYKWGVSSGNDNVSTFMHCLECTRHYSPLQGYVDIVKEAMDTTSRRSNHCPNEQRAWHGSMAIVGVKDGNFVWKCLHTECRE